MTDQQPEALRLADECDASAIECLNETNTRRAAAATIRRLHAENEALKREIAAANTRNRDEAFEAVRKAFCNLQRYSFFLDSRGNVRRCADHSGNWVEFEAVHTLFEPQSVDAALAAKPKQGEQANG